MLLFALLAAVLAFFVGTEAGLRGLATLSNRLSANVVAIGGSWIAPAADIGAGAWDTIAQRAKAARALWEDA